MSEKEGETQIETDIGLLRCRTCLQELDANSGLVDMYQCWVTPWKGMESTIAEDLAKLTNIEIKYTDNYPKVMCEPCCLKLQNACDFVHSVRMNDSFLRQRNMNDGNIDIWPKPIQIDKNINKTVYNNVMDIEIKQELPEVECTDSNTMGIYKYNEFATVEIKIEPEGFIQENQIIDDNQESVVECFLPKDETTNILQRYAPKDLPDFPKCKHNTKSLKCGTLTMNDLMNIHKDFYSSKDKLNQDNFILRNCVTKSIERHRPTNGTRSAKNMSVTYYLHKNEETGVKNVRVCKEAFMSILNVGKDRIFGVLQRSHQSAGALAKENRGNTRSKKNYEIEIVPK